MNQKPTKEDVEQVLRDMGDMSPTPDIIFDRVLAICDAYLALQQEVEADAQEIIETAMQRNEAVARNIKLLSENAALKAENEKLKVRLKHVQEDAQDDARGAAIERGWQERQGEDYGSY